jgi:hypothetical protein
MKSNILKSLSLLLLLVCFGKMNAQSDLLAFNAVTTETAPSEMIAKFVAEEKIKISDFYPNPSSSNTIVSIKCLSPIAMKVKFFTMNGDLAKEETHSLDKGDNQISVDMNSLDKGIYMVQFYSKEGSAVRRIIKMN